jgi:hypothetical protein
MGALVRLCCVIAAMATALPQAQSVSHELSRRNNSDRFIPKSHLPRRIDRDVDSSAFGQAHMIAVKLSRDLQPENSFEDMLYIRPDRRPNAPD